MSVKVTTVASKTESKPYPKLMSANVDGGKLIVLMVSDRTGTILQSPSDSSGKVGERKSAFSMEMFTDYNEEVTLENG